MSEIARQFGGNLQCLRERAGLTQETMGLLASLHRTEVSQLERGLRVPRLDTIVKLRDVLGVSTDELVAGIVWTPSEYSPGGFAKKAVSGDSSQVR